MESADYFPLESGIHWRYSVFYETMDGPTDSIFVIENLPVSRIDGNTVYTQKTLNDQYYIFTRDETGILFLGEKLASDSIDNKASEYVFRYPLETGHKWEGASRTRVLMKTGPPQKTLYKIHVDIPVEFEVISTNETVTVPAGVFKNCLRIRTKGSGFYNAGNYIGKTIISIHDTSWYAPGVGLVKVIREEMTTSRALDLGTLVMELESYWKQ